VPTKEEIKSPDLKATRRKSSRGGGLFSKDKEKDETTTLLGR